jgi:hypothetical protein
MLTRFQASKVQELLDHARGCKVLRRAYTQEDDEALEPGLWLVGDQGVYLMSNGVRDEDRPSSAVYAEECNPDTVEFEDWWAFKRASFGGDDGVEYLDPSFVQPGLDLKAEFLWLDITPTTIDCVSPAPTRLAEERDAF